MGKKGRRQMNESTTRVTRTVVLFTLCVLVAGGWVSCGRTPAPGTYKGDGVYFIVTADRQKVADLQVSMATRGGMGSVQWARQSLKIEKNEFHFFRSGNSFLGIPEFDFKGRFTSAKEASGTMNGVPWTARRVSGAVKQE